MEATEGTSTAQPPVVLYVLIPPSPLFVAHWSLFVPDRVTSNGTGSQQNKGRGIGRRIHVAGDRLNGFRLEIVRQYDVEKHERVGKRRFAIGTVSDEALAPLMKGDPALQDQIESYQHKEEEEGGGYIDIRPIDRLESAILEIEAPGPSLTSISNSEASNGRRVKGEVRDCQWWVKQVVLHLLQRGMIHQYTSTDCNKVLSSPLEVLESLPKH